jgi:hypothetical protein
MFEDSYLDSYWEDQAEMAYDGGGWAGDGSGVDDLADYNQNEADDYRDEGGCDEPDDCEWDGPAEDAYIDATCD